MNRRPRPIARRIIGIKPPTVRIHRPTEHIPSSLGLLRHFVVLGALGRAKAVVLVLGARRRQEIDDEAPDVEDVDEGDGPLDDGGPVVVVLIGEDAEGDGEAELDEDEGELDPEGRAQDAVFAEVDPEPLVFGADEDGGDDVAGAIALRDVC